MDYSKPIEIAALLLLLLCTQPVGLQLRRGIRCIEEEREALLDFKSGLDDPSNRLSSWAVEDDECCQWEGVRCNNRTGRVERLHLRGPDDKFAFDGRLGGEIRPSLLALTHLRHLDLSMDYFHKISIPKFLGSFKELRYLNLSYSEFKGRVPPELGNLSTLRHLYLSCNDDLCLNANEGLHVDDARWLSRLTSLRHLDMSSVMFQDESSYNWLHALNMLPSILEIQLSSSELNGLPSSLTPHNNLTLLSVLDLSANSINSTIPKWLCSLTSLSHLDLSNNQFYGPIPTALGNMISLEYLDLSGNSYLHGEIPKTLANLCNLSTLGLSDLGVSGYLNELREVFSGCMRNTLESLELRGTNLTGYLPDWFGGLKNLVNLDMSTNKLYGYIPASLGNLTSLQFLDLNDNKLNGPIPKTLGQLSNLITLDVVSNNFDGVLWEAHFMNLTNLKHIDISDNPLLALRVGSDWNPPFRLDGIYMGSCQLGPQFPAWLRTQENYTDIDMSYTGISDTIPDWFWNLSTQFDRLSLSHNRIGGNLQSLISNQAVLLDLSDNLLSGRIPSNLWDAMPNLEYLYISNNRIYGTIPLIVCKAKMLSTLYLSNNFLSGELPKCWENTSALVILDLSNNYLSGGLPGSIFTNNIGSLQLGSNIMSGELPFPDSNCTELVVLDLSRNRFNGSIPTWTRQSFSSLKILSLHSNMLRGSIPSQLSNLDALQILDLSNNQLSGFIPQSFGNFTAMKFYHNISEAYANYIYHRDNLTLIMKGRELSHSWILLSIVMTIDLSNNSLSGSIPKEVGNLIGLENLNLSGNQLSGEIIKELGEMRQLESLDLSRNNFSGRIPSSLSNIYSLNHLNLSYNNLRGRIPTGDQLQTLDDPSIYMGNDDLCGPPLMKKCPDDETPQTVGSGFTTNEETEGSNDIVWIYSFIAPGFVVGLSAFFGLLTLKTKWRIAYLRFIDNMCDRIFVAIAINMKTLKRWMTKFSNHGLTRRT